MLAWPGLCAPLGCSMLAGNFLVLSHGCQIAGLLHESMKNLPIKLEGTLLYLLFDHRLIHSQTEMDLKLQQVQSPFEYHCLDVKWNTNLSHFMRLN
jgi:hypothetical protein